MNNARILVVDDNESIHEDFRKILQPHNANLNSKLSSLEAGLFSDTPISAVGSSIQYQVDFAHQGEEALEMLRKAERNGCPYALCFMDVRMPPGWDGIQTIAHIWKELPYTEVVICTAYSDYSWEDIVTTLGSTDRLLFISKPFDATAIKQMALALVTKWNLGNEARNHVVQLEREVNERTAQLQDVLREVNQKNKELEHLALHDTLTGLSNRALFNDRLSHSIDRARRDQYGFAVLLMDLDRFKDINDTYGHHVGDRLLQDVASRLRAALRASDTVARLGGDEFAAILYNVTVETCEIIAKKIHDSLIPMLTVEEHSVSASASIGIALYPEHGDNPEALLKGADLAMYSAKRSGNGFAFFDEKENERCIDRLQLVHDLDLAIRNDELMQYYQPIVDLTTHQVSGVEALARWNHPSLGFVSPEQFIPLAEQKGLINSLTGWALNSAVAQCAQWHRSGIQIGMSVNLSARNFMDATLLTSIVDCLKRHQLEPHWLTLEITEGMSITNPERALDIIRTIDNMGVHVSVDDFGTGYSSLTYLMKIPVKELKLDRSFILCLLDNRNTRAIVSSTIDLAHSLGMKVVAEGVESEKILKVLLDLGCDKVQGYYLGIPQPAAESSTWLRESSWGVSGKRTEFTVN